MKIRKQKKAIVLLVVAVSVGVLWLGHVVGTAGDLAVTLERVVTNETHNPVYTFKLQHRAWDSRVRATLVGQGQVSGGIALLTPLLLTNDAGEAVTNEFVQKGDGVLIAVSPHATGRSSLMVEFTRANVSPLSRHLISMNEKACRKWRFNGRRVVPLIFRDSGGRTIDLNANLSSLQ